MLALRLRCLAVLLLLFTGAAPLRAQLSDEARISLITILPGDVVYSLFGHSALRVYDPATDLDVSFNYGTFGFTNPLLFGVEFSYGKLDYFLSVQSWPHALNFYWNVERRPVIEQVLNLDAAQRDAVFHFLQRNALPENRYYRYDFFFDNCSTRIRDVLETVLGDAVRFVPGPASAASFRDLIDPYLIEQPFLDLGMDLGLGLPADRTATPREAMFLPLYLMEAFDHATITREGRPLPLVARTDAVAGTTEAAALVPARPWPALLLWGLLAAGLLLTVRDLHAARARRPWFDGFLFGFVGVAGLVIVFLWFISLHTVTQNNLNLLWAWPTHLIAAVILLRRARVRWLRSYLLATAYATLGLTMAWFFLPQEMPDAVLPLLLLLAVRSAVPAFASKRLPSSPAPA